MINSRYVLRGRDHRKEGPPAKGQDGCCLGHRLSLARQGDCGDAERVHFCVGAPLARWKPGLSCLSMAVLLRIDRPARTPPRKGARLASARPWWSTCTRSGPRSMDGGAGDVETTAPVLHRTVPVLTFARLLSCPFFSGRTTSTHQFPLLKGRLAAPVESHSQLLQLLIRYIVNENRKTYRRVSTGEGDRSPSSFMC